MKMLFIVDHDANINQIVMFVPNDYDHGRVREAAQACGIKNPNVLVIIAMPGSDAQRLIRQTDFYAPYSR